MSCRPATKEIRNVSMSRALRAYRPCHQLLVQRSTPLPDQLGGVSLDHRASNVRNAVPTKCELDYADCLVGPMPSPFHCRRQFSGPKENSRHTELCLFSSLLESVSSAVALAVHRTIKLGVSVLQIIGQLERRPIQPWFELPGRGCRTLSFLGGWASAEANLALH